MTIEIAPGLVTETFGQITGIVNMSPSPLTRELRSKYIAQFLNDFVEGTRKSRDLEEEMVILAQEVLRDAK